MVRPPPVARLPLHSSSASRLTAGAAGFLILSQWLTRRFPKIVDAVAQPRWGFGMGCVLKSLSVSYPWVFCVSPAADAPLPAQPRHRLQLCLEGGNLTRPSKETIGTVSLQLSRRLGTNPLARRPIRPQSVPLLLARRLAPSNMGTGAALGAGTGLVAGSAIGAGNGDAAGGSLQVRYDTVYAQCMTAKGNRIGGPPVAEPVYVYRPPDYWGPRYYFSYGW